MNSERMEAWCARGTQALLLAVIVYAPLAFAAAASKEFAVVQGLMAGVAVLWAGQICFSKSFRLFWPPVAWAVLLFLAYASIRYAQADVEYIARQELFRLLVYGFFFLALLNHLPRPASGRAWLMVLLGLAALVALYAVVQFLTGSDAVWHVQRPAVYANRGSGTYISPNHLAGFLEMLLPAALIYALGGSLPFWARVLAACSSVALLAGLVVSGSRGGWLATGFSLLLLFGWMALSGLFRLKAALSVIALAALAVLLVGKGNWSPNRLGAFRDAGQLVDIRFILWLKAIDMWRDHPWLGVGPDHFDVRYAQYRPPDNTLQRQPQRVHNDYLNVLVDWGVIGALLVGLAWGVWFWRAWRDWPPVRRSWLARAPPGVELAPTTLAALFGLSAIWAHALVDFNLHVPANALVAVSLAALVAAQGRHLGAGYQLALTLPMRSAAAFTLVALGGLLALQASRLGREWSWLSAAQALPAYSLQKAELLKKAHAIEPAHPETAYQIGECYRLSSWHGNDDYRELAQQALPWFQRAMRLNPWDPLARVRYGMCLDWLGRHDEAEPFFLAAGKLDWNGYYTMAHLGWHYMQVGDYTAARRWLDRSFHLYWEDNPIAAQYLGVIWRARHQNDSWLSPLLKGARPTEGE